MFLLYVQNQFVHLVEFHTFDSLPLLVILINYSLSNFLYTLCSILYALYSILSKGNGVALHLYSLCLKLFSCESPELFLFVRYWY